MENKRILLVEDDETLGYVLQEYLEMNSFQVRWGKDGHEGWELFQTFPFDLCLLDVMMPKKDGFELAREIRQQNLNVPILFLTAKSMKIDKLKGFNLGGDDYVTKPVDEEELLLRIKAILRRSSNTYLEERELYNCGKFTFNFRRRVLTLGDLSFDLTDKEAELLKMLTERKNQLLDRDETLKQLWGKNDYFNRRSMDVHISHLRKMLKADPQLKIVNVHGKGFVLVEE
jgi:DNA-binding response OmpR family regulator